MIFSPITYDEPVFRPPAEAYSAIIQATLGCSWNKCAFCEMYSSKKFKTRPFENIKSEIRDVFNAYGSVKKVFLADGDAFVLSSSKLLEILQEINNQASNNGLRIQRVSSYALPKNIISKTDQELKTLRENGLKLLYIGIETGDNELLRLINKGESYKTTLEGVQKAHNAGIDTSIMIINGLGGKKYSKQHSIESAKIITELSPKFLSSLTLSFPFGEEHFKSKFNGDYIQQSNIELFEELKLFISNIDSKNIIFRSNHVSNNLNLAGVLSKDKSRIINDIEFAIQSSTPNQMPKRSNIL